MMPRHSFVTFPCLLSLALLAFQLPARALPESMATLSLARFDLTVKAVPNTPPLVLTGALILRPSTGAGEPIRLAVSAGKEITVRLAPGTSWEVEGEIPGFWVRRTTMMVSVPGAEIVHRVELWPKGQIAGRIKLAERGARLPDQVVVTTLAAPKYLHRQDAPKGLLECPVDKKGAWSCSLPAAPYDLTVSVPGFVPHYFWSVAVPVGKSLDLGSFELKRGASVAGWVAVEAGRIDPARCIAKLAPLLPAGVSLEVASRLERTAVEARVRQDGFFQLPGLTPGSYQLEIRQPPLAPARFYPVQVASGAETFVPEPILLHPAVNLELSISPPLDWLGKAWHVQVSKAAEGSARFKAPVFDAAADTLGHVRVPGQANGRFEVRVADSLGNRLYWDDDLRIERADDARRSIEVELVTIKGTVALGRDPLAATLWFGGNANTTVAVKMESDKDGRFHGVLPKTRFWRVGIKATDPKLDVQTRVEVHANPSGVARVDISLPDTRVFGRVVDDSGQPAPNATVGLFTKETDLFVSADEKGAFEARAVPEGDADLAAEAARDAPDPNEVSDRLRLSLASGRPAGPVELQLRRTRTLTGKVLSPRGPVAGAVLDFAALGPDSNWLGAGHATTDLAGAWTVRLPEKTARAQLVVSPPGNALKTFDIPADGSEATLSVSEEGGTLEVVLPYSEDEFWQNETGLRVAQNGVNVSLGAWARTHEGGLWGAKAPVRRTPALAPGEYQVCIVPHSLDPLRNLSACTTGQLSNGGTLRLTPPRK
jgi:hypothetical protein